MSGSSLASLVCFTVLVGAKAPTVSAQTPLLNVKNTNGVRVLTSNADGSFLALGSFGIGAIPGSGTDVRLMWYPAKGAFRVGRAESGQWSDANIGPYSAALGLNVSATGDYSSAMGTNTTASGAGSSAIGMNTTASGSASTAMGFLSTATGAIATAMGAGTTAQSYGSVVIGRYNVVDGTANSWVDTDALFVAGNGTDFGTPSNALKLYKNGKLETAGEIRSLSGGFKFPDGTVQTSAATGTAANAANTIVARDGSGGFSAGAVAVSQLTVNGDDGMLAAGTFNSGSILATVPGVRLMWYPRKAAFRAGQVSGTQWSDANIGAYSTGMGQNTTASGQGATAMGSSTTASGTAATAVGSGTVASSGYSTAAGYNSIASGSYSVAMGGAATASGNSSVAMGANAQASGDISLALGRQTIASGHLSTAIGNYASTNSREGSFVYGDASVNVLINSSVDNQFMVRAAGGTIFYSNPGLTAGVSLAAGGGAWASVSDAAKKQLFTDIDGELVLAKIRAMPVREWSYKSQDASIRHLGPTAQDFYQAFSLGESNLTITTTDIDGVNLLAAQALEKRTTELRAENAALKEELSSLRREVAAIKALLQRNDRSGQ